MIVCLQTDFLNINNSSMEYKPSVNFFLSDLVAVEGEMKNLI